MGSRPCIQALTPGRAPHWGCGKCYVCRSKQVNTWVARHTFEAAYTGALALFCTFTLEDEQLALSPTGLPTLDKGQMQRFHKRLRKAGYVFKMDYVGEYGPETGRPHYHGLYHLRERRGSFVRADDILTIEAEIRDIWGHGHVSLYPAEAGGIAYVAGHAFKRREKDDPWYRDRLPEFRTVGQGIAKDYPEFIRRSTAKLGERFPAVVSNMGGDCPVVYRTQGRKHYIGYRLAQLTREAVGVSTQASDRTPLPRPPVTAEAVRGALAFHEKKRRDRRNARRAGRIA